MFPPIKNKGIKTTGFRDTMWGIESVLQDSSLSDDLCNYAQAKRTKKVSTDLTYCVELFLSFCLSIELEQGWVKGGIDQGMLQRGRWAFQMVGMEFNNKIKELYTGTQVQRKLRQSLQFVKKIFYIIRSCKHLSSNLPFNVSSLS